MAIEKIKILAAVLELPAKQQCQSSPFTSKIGPNGLDWQCYLAGSSKTAPRILIFSIAIGADYSYEMKNSEIQAPAFFKHNNPFIATVNQFLRIFTSYTFFSIFSDMGRSMIALFIAGFFCMFIAFTTGVVGCWKTAPGHIVSSAIMMLLACKYTIRGLTKF